jgi:hypothetical protein
MDNASLYLLAFRMLHSAMHTIKHIFFLYDDMCLDFARIEPLQLFLNAWSTAKTSKKNLPEHYFSLLKNTINTMKNQCKLYHKLTKLLRTQFNVTNKFNATKNNIYIGPSRGIHYHSYHGPPPIQRCFGRI